MREPMKLRTASESVGWLNSEGPLSESPKFDNAKKLSLHRCTICGTRWLLWPDETHGGGWNLLDKYQRPGSCCDNVAMGDQIEHLRDFDLAVL